MKIQPYQLGKALVGIGMCLIGMMPTWALGQGSTLFVAGNEAFTSGDYIQAVIYYDSSLRADLPSADTYFNLGCAYEKLDQTGQAIWAYERALALAPYHDDALHNLAILQDNLLDAPAVTEPWWEALGPRFGRSYTWAWLALGGMALVLVFGSLYLFGQSVASRKLGFYLGVVSCLWAIGAAGVMWAIQSGRSQQAYGVVISPEASVKPSPEASETLLRLPEGSKLVWDTEMGQWVKVRYQSKARQEQIGYVAASQIRKI